MDLHQGKLPTTQSSRPPTLESKMPLGRRRVEFDPSVSQSVPHGKDDISGNALGLSRRADISHRELAQSVHAALAPLYPDEQVSGVRKPRPAIRKASKIQAHASLDQELDDFGIEKKVSGMQAQERAVKLSKSVGTSRCNSRERTPPSESVDAAHCSDDEFDTTIPASQLYKHHARRRRPDSDLLDLYHSDNCSNSGQSTPLEGGAMQADRDHRLRRFRTGVLGSLLKTSTALQTPISHVEHGKKPSSHIANGIHTLSGQSTTVNSRSSSPSRSGTSTPRKSWYTKGKHPSTNSLSWLMESSTLLATPGQQDMSHEMQTHLKRTHPGMGKRTRSADSIASTLGKLGRSRRDNDYKIRIHLAGTLSRQSYLRKLCKALMMYGAPTHRLEMYMHMSARVLEIEAQFLYMPGCMIIAFDDSSVHTSEVKLVRTNQGVDLGKLRDVHEIYKDVVHDRLNVEEAMPRLEAIMARKAKFGAWLRVLVYGIASASVGPFAFSARPIDLPFCFLLGSLLGWLQLIVSPGNELFSNVFEIGAAVATSFLARALGSINGVEGKPIFCFSAMAQSSIALILPGFTVLSASLELQSKHIVAGSVRMVYAIIYSLFLGFGITIGTALFGTFYKDATSATQCSGSMSSPWYYVFVVIFSLCLMIINQAKWKQMPAMSLISLAGYFVNYHSSQYFTGNAQVSNTLGALTIGIVANLQARFGRHVENWCLDTWEGHFQRRWEKLLKKSRRWPRSISGGRQSLRERSVAGNDDLLLPYQRKIGYGLAAAAMLPAIFVQVPSGLSVQGSLIAGLASADQITRNTTTSSAISSASESTSFANSIALNVGFSVIQIAIGITVGLFLAALMVYPLGKRRSGLFSF